MSDPAENATNGRRMWPSRSSVRRIVSPPTAAIAVIRRPLAMIQVSVVMMRRPAAPRDQQLAWDSSSGELHATTMALELAAGLRAGRLE